MSNVAEVRWRLLCEQLVRVYRQADADLGEAGVGESECDPTTQDSDVELLLRLTGAVLALLESHAVDAKGRCRARACVRLRWTSWCDARCRTLVTIHFWMR